MTARGEGLPTAPRVYTLTEQAQLLRRWRYGCEEMGLSRDVGLRLWQRPSPDAEPWSIQHSFRNLAAALVAYGVPETLPVNAAAPPRRTPRSGDASPSGQA